MYRVILITPPRQNDFRSDFFPRTLRYKDDAQRLIDEVRRKGGDAIVERVKK